jgi:hypothetical protein
MVGEPSAFTELWRKGLDIIAAIAAGSLSGWITSNLFWKSRKRAELKMQQEFDLDTQRKVRADREVEEEAAHMRSARDSTRRLWSVVHRDVDVAATDTIAEKTEELVCGLKELSQTQPDQRVEAFVNWWNERMARCWPRHDGPTMSADHVREFKGELDRIKPYLFSAEEGRGQ